MIDTLLTGPSQPAPAQEATSRKVRGPETAGSDVSDGETEFADAYAKNDVPAEDQDPNTKDTPQQVPDLMVPKAPLELVELTPADAEIPDQPLVETQTAEALSVKTVHSEVKTSIAPDTPVVLNAAPSTADRVSTNGSRSEAPDALLVAPATVKPSAPLVQAEASTPKLPETGPTRAEDGAQVLLPKQPTEAAPRGVVAEPTNGTVREIAEPTLGAPARAADQDGKSSPITKIADMAPAEASVRDVQAPENSTEKTVAQTANIRDVSEANAKPTNVTPNVSETEPNPEARLPEIPRDQPRALSSKPVALSPAKEAQVVRQVADQLPARLLTGPNGAFEIRLDPPDLGRITVRILGVEAGAIAQISADRQDVLDLLRRNETLFTREFGDSGFEGLTFEFQSHADSDQSGRDESSAEKHDWVQEIAALDAPLNGSGTGAGAGLLDIRL